MGMKIKPRRLVLPSDVFEEAVAAGIMASSKGSAMEAPTLLRNVRRGNAFFVMIMVRSFSSGTADSVPLQG